MYKNNPLCRFVKVLCETIWCNVAVIELREFCYRDRFVIAVIDLELEPPGFPSPLVAAKRSEWWTSAARFVDAGQILTLPFTSSSSQFALCLDTRDGLIWR